MTSHESPGLRGSTRQTALIIWGAFLAGALGLTVIAAVFGPRIWPRVSGAGEILAWVVFAMALACLAASSMLPRRIKSPGAPVENITVARSVVATALNGSIALFAPLAWMVSGKPIAVVALAIALVGLLICQPSERRWQSLRRAVAAAGGQEPVAGAEVSTPQPPLSRKVLGLAVGLLALCVGALFLVGDIFWSEEVLRRPASPIVRGLLVLILALMATGFAIVRFVRASCSKRPLWQRAYGVLLLVLAGYLLVHSVRIP